MIGAFSAFSATTANSGNSIATGTVALQDNDAGSVLYDVTNAKPGDTVDTCIQVTYTGSLASGVKLYTPDTIGRARPVRRPADHARHAGELRRSPTARASPPSGAPLFNGTLDGFATAHSDWASGLPTLPAAPATSGTPTTPSSTASPPPSRTTRTQAA